MSATLTPIGTLTIGVAVPAALELSAALLATCNIAAPNISAQLTALAGFNATLNPGLAEMLAMAEAIIANIEAALAAIPPIPTLSLSAQVALALQITIDLTALLNLINVYLSLQISISALLATGGVEAYVYDGPKNAMGAEITATLGGDTSHANAIVLLTTSPSAWVAMQGVFKTSP